MKPALTAEEWAGDAKLTIGGDRIWIEGDVLESGYWTRHALAALCLYGQPFGFTWEDVDVLRRIFIKQTESIADRIAALLPPREET